MLVLGYLLILHEPILEVLHKMVSPKYRNLYKSPSSSAWCLKHITALYTFEYKILLIKRKERKNFLNPLQTSSFDGHIPQNNPTSTSSSGYQMFTANKPLRHHHTVKWQYNNEFVFSELGGFTGGHGHIHAWHNSADPFCPSG